MVTEGQPEQGGIEQGPDVVDNSTLADELRRLGDDGELHDDPPAEGAEPEVETDEAPPVDAESIDADEDEDEDEEGDDDRDAKLDAASKREQRERERIDAYYNEREARLAALIEKAEAAQQPSNGEASIDLGELQARAKYDPVGALAALGVDVSASGKAIAEQAYALSAEAKDKPQLREKAAQTLQLREALDKATKAARELEEYKRSSEKRFEELQQAQSQSLWMQRYVARIESRVGDDAPLTKALLTEDPDAAYEQFQQTASQIYRETQKVPKPSAVIARLEKSRRAERSRIAKLYGLEAPASGPKDAPKTKTPAAATQTTKATTNEAINEQPPQGELSDDELRDQIVREMREGRLG